MPYSDDEDEFVTRQREELHHTNEKFMRELKRKYEDIKKTRAEGEPRRKDSPEKAQGTT
jgi:intein-encoded DNA endonuclease-like protein